MLTDDELKAIRGRWARMERQDSDVRVLLDEVKELRAEIAPLRLLAALHGMGGYSFEDVKEK